MLQFVLLRSCYLLLLWQDILNSVSYSSMFPTLFSIYTFKVSYYLQITGFINHKKKG